jgi:hypothetical protein
MTMHYLADLKGFLRAVRRSIAPEGVFVFSVEHPMVTSFYNGDFRERIPDSWTVRDYFRQGARPCPWLGAEVLKRHRTFADYFTALTECGFSPSALSEGDPDPRRFSDPGIFECRKSIPMYAIFQARRTA